MFQSYLVVFKGSFEVGQGALDTAGQLGVVVALEHLQVQLCTRLVLGCVIRNSLTFFLCHSAGMAISPSQRPSIVFSSQRFWRTLVPVNHKILETLSGNNTVLQSCFPV